ncbi:Regulator of K+ conductance, N-terminal [Ostreococcus tauri]|uniref:Regulator of K+ conductance, N-terminal n=2 Tax=Ostreococcus tauri TaxID=70448 RepID=A0A090MD20_OSTTA|nr:Regulator of K+ conductance, N-terminal [Ostreococcus tauri]CEF99944.1 Regulator of K+ conductance, N-terminal [Ostreococcus tauri]|eukprot:XP_003082403.2 Regulator of K+ conductance, N-terminal [Ostreococcus tauri]
MVGGRGRWVGLGAAAPEADGSSREVDANAMGGRDEVREVREDVSDAEVKEMRYALATEEKEREEREAQAKALAEQAVLATEAYEKDEELAQSAMNSAQEKQAAVLEAVTKSDAWATRLAEVTAFVEAERAGARARGENEEEVLNSATCTIGPEMSWCDEDSTSLADALVRARASFETAEQTRKELEIELENAETFAKEAADAAKRSKELARIAHESADKAMEKVTAKMEAVVALNEKLKTMEIKIGEQQAETLIVPQEGDAVAAIVLSPEALLKKKQDLKNEVKQDLAEKRAAKDEDSDDEGSSESAKKSNQFASAGYFSAPKVTGDVDASLLKKIVTAIMLFSAATLMLPTSPMKAIRTQIYTSIVSVRDTVGASINVVQKGATSAYERIIPEDERKTIAHATEEAEETGMTDVLWLLFASVFAVTIVSKIPGGSPVLGFLLGGAIIGPFGLGMIHHVSSVKVLAEFGVVFLLFNIGLELSYERLVSMAKFIFGLGSAQMFLTTAVGAAVAVACGLAVPAAVIVGLGLAFSSTAVALQVLADRGESASRHGRATFSVLLFQDLMVVLVFMLVPLLAGPDSGSFTALATSLAKAVLKTIVGIVGIIGIGRIVLRPVFNRVAKLRQAELLSATTLFVALGTALLTQALGLSMELGAFLAGLLLAETEFHLQVESDIAPFRGLLLGLFFMTVGMTIDAATFIQSAGSILGITAALLIGKIAVMCLAGPLFGMSLVNSLRASMYVGPGGEFAFVTFAESVRVGLFSATLATQLNLAVVLTMAITPYLAEFGNKLKDIIPQKTVQSMQPKEDEVDDLKGHVIIAGFGRTGKTIGDILSANMIPFVALDVNPEVVRDGRAADKSVFFGDAGSPELLKKVGADRASCAIVALSSPAANYRAVWTLSKNFSNVQTYVKADGVEGGLILEKAGAKAVVPESLEPSLQLAAACLRESKMSPNDITVAIDTYRRNQLKMLKKSRSRGFADYSSVNYGGVSADQVSVDEDVSA